MAKKVGIKKIGERTGHFWKREKKRTGETYFDENLKGQVKNRTQEWKDLLEVWAASPADALRTWRERAEGGALAGRRTTLWKTLHAAHIIKDIFEAARPSFTSTSHDAPWSRSWMGRSVCGADNGKFRGVVFLCWCLNLPFSAEILCLSWDARVVLKKHLRKT